MKLVYRLCHSSYGAASGEGARRYGGRWNPVGRPAIYAAESRALCILERLVHLTRLPRGEIFTPILIPDGVAIHTLDPHVLPAGWDSSVELAAVQMLAAKAMADRDVAVLMVPSVIVPGESCYVLDPAHAQFEQIQFEPGVPFEYDRRLIREGRTVC